MSFASQQISGGSSNGAGGSSSATSSDEIECTAEDHIVSISDSDSESSCYKRKKSQTPDASTSKKSRTEYAKVDIIDLVSPRLDFSVRAECAISTNEEVIDLLSPDEASMDAETFSTESIENFMRMMNPPSNATPNEILKRIAENGRHVGPTGQEFDEAWLYSVISAAVRSYAQRRVGVR